MCSAFATLREPWHITCSKRGANPVLPFSSCFDPTSYQMLMATTGARWSSATIRRRPFERRSSLHATGGTGVVGTKAPGRVLVVGGVWSIVPRRIGPGRMRPLDRQEDEHDGTPGRPEGAVERPLRSWSGIGDDGLDV